MMPPLRNVGCDCSLGSFNFARVAEKGRKERRGEEAKRWETSFKLWGRSWPSTRHPSTPSSFPPKTTTRFSSSPPFLNTSFFVVAVVAFIPSHVIVVRDSDLFSFPWSMPFCRFLMRDEFNWFGFFFFFCRASMSLRATRDGNLYRASLGALVTIIFIFYFSLRTR